MKGIQIEWCEFCEQKKRAAKFNEEANWENLPLNKPTRVLRLTDGRNPTANSMQWDNRRPGRIAVCWDCEKYLCTESEMPWKSEGEYKGSLNAEEIYKKDPKEPIFPPVVKAKNDEVQG